MTDIQNTQDLTTLFRAFYTELLLNPQMHHIFMDVAQLDIEKHLPVIVSFWEQVIFGTGNYKANVLAIHQHLNTKVPLEKHHFQKWLDTLFKVLDAHFSGVNSERLKTRALSIAQIIQLKLNNF